MAAQQSVSEPKALLDTGPLCCMRRVEAPPVQVHSVTVSQSMHCHPAALQKEALLAAAAKPADVAGAPGCWGALSIRMWGGVGFG